MPVTARQTRSRRLNIRTTPKQQRLIQLAAELRGTNLSAFVLESACVQAEHAIADKRTFEVSAEDWQVFMRKLDRPAQSRPALRKLLSQPSVLERER